MMVKKKANGKLVDITLVVDRSGSMSSCLSDAEGGINTFIKDQKKEDGKAVFSLIQFDTEYETVHSGIPMKDVPQYKLEPRGMTALLDAVGRGINGAKGRIEGLTKKKNPSLTVFVIVTDGHENSSKEFNKEQVSKLIKEQTKEGWQFTFLGADSASFDEAQSWGIAKSGIATYNASAHTQDAYFAMSSNVSRMRGQTLSGETVTNSYTADERKAMAGK